MFLWNETDIIILYLFHNNIIIMYTVRVFADIQGELFPVIFIMNGYVLRSLSRKL